jgi:hypothetical protein
MKLLSGRVPAFLLLLILAGAAGCSSRSAAPPPGAGEAARPVRVEIDGTPGVRFEGTFGEPPEAKTITGAIPATFSLEMRRAVFVRVQKAVQDGKLTVRLLINGAEVASGVTTKPFGLVALAYPTKPRAR